MPKDEKDETGLETLNDIEDEQDENALEVAKGLGLDNMMAKHLAHMFTRDPLVVFDDAIYLNNNEALDHFDNVQSTNWRTVRWKAPIMSIGQTSSTSGQLVFKSEHGPGWRVESDRGRPSQGAYVPREQPHMTIQALLVRRTMRGTRTTWGCG